MTLITGASAGIGRALAERFAAAGHALALSARRADALEALAADLRQKHGVAVAVLPADLADPAAPAKLLADVDRAGLTLDVLVANAGFGQYGPFAGADERELMNLLQVNVAALTHLVRLALPGMLARGKGRVMTVASIAAYMPGPRMAAYYASKAYVLSLSEALSEELKGTPVTVTCLCPGPTRTEFAERAAFPKSGLLDGPGAMTAEAVAAAGYAGLVAGRRVVTPGFRNRALTLAVRLAPRGLLARLVDRLQRAKQPSLQGD